MLALLGGGWEWDVMSHECDDDEMPCSRPAGVVGMRHGLGLGPHFFFVETWLKVGSVNP